MEMSVSERSTVAPRARDFDPLLKDLDEKKQSFRRNVVSLAVELKEVRSRLAAQEQSFAREIFTRQEVETKAKCMEEEVCKLHKRLEERNEQLHASASAAEKYLDELDKLRVELSATQTIADASSASASATQLQCLALLKELNEKSISLKEHEDRVARLGEQLDDLEKNLGLRESCQKQLKDEISKIEHDIMAAVSAVGANQDHELRRLMDEVSPRDIEKFNQLLVGKDEEIAKIKDEIRIMSAHWKFKTKELESQLEKQRRADQELKKRVLKLEFCLQDSRSQTRKLQRMEERRDRAIKEIRDRLVSKEAGGASAGSEKPKFWETSGFKIAASMSMLVLVVFSRR